LAWAFYKTGETGVGSDVCCGSPATLLLFW